jgi:hypothetical protein
MTEKKLKYQIDISKKKIRYLLEINKQLVNKSKTRMKQGNKIELNDTEN